MKMGIPALRGVLHLAVKTYKSAGGRSASGGKVEGESRVLGRQRETTISSILNLKIAEN